MIESNKIGASDLGQKIGKGKVIKQRKGGDKANFNGNERKRGKKCRQQKQEHELLQLWEAWSLCS